MGKRGRKKIVISESQINLIEAYASRGLSHEEIYYTLGLTKDVFYNNKKENPEITEALKRGKSRGHLEISNKLFDSARKGNTVAQIFYLKCKAGWKETNALELTGKDGDAIKQDITSSTAKRVMDRLAKVGERLRNKETISGDET